jgi:hypothetical protein
LQRGGEGLGRQVEREIRSAGALPEVGVHGAHVAAVEERERVGVGARPHQQLLIGIARHLPGV